MEPVIGSTFFLPLTGLSPLLQKLKAKGVNKPSVLHKFPGILFSNRPGNEIIKSLREEYGILEEEKLEGELNEMCNLSEGIFERGVEKGIDIGKLNFAIDTYLDGVTSKEYIMRKFNLSEEEFEEAIKNIAN